MHNLAQTSRVEIQPGTPVHFHPPLSLLHDLSTTSNHCFGPSSRSQQTQMLWILQFGKFAICPHRNLTELDQMWPCRDIDTTSNNVNGEVWLLRWICMCLLSGFICLGWKGHVFGIFSVKSDGDKYLAHSVLFPVEAELGAHTESDFTRVTLMCIFKTCVLRVYYNICDLLCNH